MTESTASEARDPNDTPSDSVGSNVKSYIANKGEFLNEDMTWPKATKKDDGLPDEIRKLGQTDLIRMGAEILTELTGRTGYFRQMAEIVIAIRIKYKTGNGMRDLQGRSQESRDAIAAMYRMAGIPKAYDSNSLQAAIRYHVRKLAWLEATPKERDVLKMKNPFEAEKDTARPAPEKPVTKPEEKTGDEESKEGTADVVAERGTSTLGLLRASMDYLVQADNNTDVLSKEERVDVIRVLMAIHKKIDEMARNVGGEGYDLCRSESTPELPDVPDTDEQEIGTEAPTPDATPDDETPTEAVAS